MEHIAITLNVGGVRYVTVHGREFAIAPATILRPRVLNGSKGPLFYPVEEIQKGASRWNGRPMVVRHPVKNGRNISANDPDIFQTTTIGWVYNSSVDKDGNNTVECWFDIELTKKVDSRIHNAIVNGQKIELSTGLYTEDIEAPKGSKYDNTDYYYIARNYQPDHLAILPDEVGACSLNDGCGVFNQKTEETTDTQTNNEDQTCACKNPIDQATNKTSSTPPEVINMEERANIVSWLTTNCKMDKSTLEKMDDATLKKTIIDNAEKGAEVDNDGKFFEWMNNADKDIRSAFVAMLKGKIKGIAGTRNEFPVKKEGEGAGAGTPEEEAMKKKKEEEAAMMNKTQQPVAANTQTFLDSLPPEYREAVVNAKKITDGEKLRLANILTAHITDNTKKQQTINSLLQKSLDDLKERVELLPPTANAAHNQNNNQQNVPQHIPYANPVATFFGQTGAPTNNDNYDLNAEKLESPTVNWKEWAKS